MVGFVEGDEIHFHIGGAGPLDEAPGKGDGAALSEDHGEAAFARVALADGVGGDHAQAPAGFEQAVGAAIERRAQVRRAAVGRISHLQPVAVLVPKGTADFQAPHKRRIAEHDVKTGEWQMARFGEWRMANSEWFV